MIMRRSTSATSVLHSMTTMTGMKARSLLSTIGCTHRDDETVEKIDRNRTPWAEGNDHRERRRSASSDIGAKDAENFVTHYPRSLEKLHERSHFTEDRHPGEGSTSFDKTSGSPPSTMRIAGHAYSY